MRHHHALVSKWSNILKTIYRFFHLDLIDFDPEEFVLEVGIV